MAGMIDEVLDTTRLQLGRPLLLERDPIDLVGLARQIAAECQKTSETHRLRVEATSPEVVGAWDGRRLERVLANLVGNAVKYSPRGGDVVIEVAGEEDDRGTWAVLRVRDNGIGIPPADLPHVFDRFRRGTNVGEIRGSGIGLANARQIVEQHGGKVEVTSTVGEGTTFTVRLPLRVPAASASSAA
jgi:signal transduction histidine kinase